MFLVFGLGVQYTHVIARSLRESGIYAKIFPFFESVENLQKKAPKGLILRGVTAFVYAKDAYKPSEKIFDLDLPILGIAVFFGTILGLIAGYFGGKTD
ncbi:glutamine amidotransferase-related protein, partial [Helicobacter pylori]|uniref:glutamine amidotransferase-related protein n=1 Tax=Helicobacter pylori TaxID=210 RepID=UPI003C783519